MSPRPQSPATCSTGLTSLPAPPRSTTTSRSCSLSDSEKAPRKSPEHSRHPPGGSIVRNRPFAPAAREAGSRIAGFMLNQVNVMGKLGLLLLLAVAAWGDTAETAIFRVVMLPASEVPAVNSTTRGTADILASVVRDNSGQIVSGTVDILARVTFAAAA